MLFKIKDCKQYKSSATKDCLNAYRIMVHSHFGNYYEIYTHTHIGAYLCQALKWFEVQINADI